MATILSKTGRRQSLMRTADIELSVELTVLKAPAKAPET